MRFLMMLALLCPLVARADDLSVAREQLAPTGRLRAAINFGNPVLAQRDADPHGARGVSAELAAELAKRLAVPLDYVLFTEAGDVFAALPKQTWDIAFLAIDPKRAAGIGFTAPYVVIEGSYLVPTGASLAGNDEVDRDGVLIGVAEGSAYDLYLSRTLQRAHLLRERNVDFSIDSLRAGRVQVVAGVKGPLEKVAADHADVRLLPGHFMVIEQAIGTPLGRPAGLAYLNGFVEEMKASGFVADALRRSGQTSAAVAGPSR